MRAYFKIDMKIVQRALELDRLHSGSPMEIVLQPCPGGLVAADGETQDVMFLIGAVASQGEAGLVGINV